jgi:hypothetical protein
MREMPMPWKPIVSVIILIVATLMNSVIGAVPAFAIAAIVLLFIWMTGGVGRE